MQAYQLLTVDELFALLTLHAGNLSSSSIKARYTNRGQQNIELERIEAELNTMLHLTSELRSHLGYSLNTED